MWELNYKESWVPKNWCFWTVVLEKIIESPLDCKEIKSVNPNGNQSWIFSGKTDAKAETPIIWPPDSKNWLIGKDPYAGKDWTQEEKGMTEDEMLGWHHQLDGYEFEPGKPSMLQSRVRHDWVTELNLWRKLSMSFQANVYLNPEKQPNSKSDSCFFVFFNFWSSNAIT